MGKYLIGVIASMIYSQDTIKGSTYIDAGAGASGIPATVAHKLGARELVLLEANHNTAEQLRANLVNNGIPKESYSVEEVDFRLWEDRDVAHRQNVFLVMDLYNYGNKNLLNGETELTSALRVLGNRMKLGIFSGGPSIGEASIAEDILNEYSIEDVLSAEYKLNRSPELAITLIARPGVKGVWKNNLISARGNRARKPRNPSLPFDAYHVGNMVVVKSKAPVDLSRYQTGLGFASSAVLKSYTKRTEGWKFLSCCG